MLQHKLLLPWDGKLVINQILKTWDDSLVNEIVVLVRHDDQELIEACQASSVVVHQLQQETADMKATIQVGLRQVEERFKPGESDLCLIAPADLPRLRTEVIDRVIQTSAAFNKIVVPYFGDKRGHPVCMPWNMTYSIFELGVNEGLNSLIDRSQYKKALFPAEKRARDIDTPADYQREIEAFNESNKS